MRGPKWAGMTGVSRGLNILSSMKRSIQSVALDSLSCSNSICLASRAGPDNSKRQRCA